MSSRKLKKHNQNEMFKIFSSDACDLLQSGTFSSSPKSFMSVQTHEFLPWTRHSQRSGSTSMFLLLFNHGIMRIVTPSFFEVCVCVCTTYYTFALHGKELQTFINTFVYVLTSLMYIGSSGTGYIFSLNITYFYLANPLLRMFLNSYQT